MSPGRSYQKLRRRRAARDWRRPAGWRRLLGALGRLRGIPALAIIAAAASTVVIVAAVGADRWVAAGAVADTTAAPNMNCTLIVPQNPLSAQGLATPYQLVATDPADGPCNEANDVQTAFVQGAVINPATGQISVYDPLVVDIGTLPVQAPAVPTLPAHAVVALWFGFNGNTLALAGADQEGIIPATTSGYGPAGSSGWSGLSAATPRLPDGPAASGTPDPTLQRANCIAGQDIDGQFSSFTQVAACNAVAFFQAANAAITAGKLRVPSPGVGKDGLACLTTRSFALIDQDQSDNVTTQYLANSAGQIAQDTSANRLMLGTGATTLSNGSDNGLLDQFVGPSLGCSPWMAPDLADGGAATTGLPLDEIQAAQWAGQVAGSGPAALVPLNDPMTVDNNGSFNAGKTNTYRMIVDMPPLPVGESPQLYCEDMELIQGTRLQEDVNLLIGVTSPMPTAADNLFTFLAQRLQASFVNLNCAEFGMTNQVTVTTDASGVVVAACFLQQVAPVTPGAGNPTAGLTTCPATTTSIPAAASLSPPPPPPMATAAPAATSPVAPSAGTAPVATVPSAQVPSVQATVTPGQATTPQAIIAAKIRWPGIGKTWGQPNPRRTWLAAVWQGVITVFLPGGRYPPSSVHTACVISSRHAKGKTYE
jgi:hypothetical protein